MINEDQLEQLAIRWFQDTGWSHAHGPDFCAVLSEEDFLWVQNPPQTS